MYSIPEYTELDSLIHGLSDLAAQGDLVFRGYNVNDEIFPSIIRGEADYRDKEYELLSMFERYALNYVNVTNYIDLMSHAQHFGLPTRLLDFTYNPFVALYFALFLPKSKGGDMTYYTLLYADINENDYQQELPKAMTYGQLGGRQSTSFATYANQAFETIEEKYAKRSERKILFLDPNQSNQRLIMQQGLFMLPYTLDKKEHSQIIEKNTKAIKIHKSLRHEIQVYLNTVGINAYRLMPDISSVCLAVKRDVIGEPV